MKIYDILLQHEYAITIDTSDSENIICSFPEFILYEPYLPKEQIVYQIRDKFLQISGESGGLFKVDKYYSRLMIVNDIGIRCNDGCGRSCYCTCFSYRRT